MSNKHPIALSICFMTEFWERYGFYISQGLITLLMIKVYGLSEGNSFALAGTFVGLVYTTSIVGGLIADKLIGHYRSTLLGEWLLIVGFICLGYGASIKSLILLYLAMALIAVGTGLVKSNISSFLGHFYAVDDPKRDMGFSIFYIGINLGSLIGGFLAGYLSLYFGWSIPFYTAAAGAMIGLYTMFHGVRKHKLDFEAKIGSVTALNFWVSVGITLLTVAFCVYVLYSSQVSDIVFIVISVLCVFLLFQTALKYPSYAKNCVAYFVLIVISVIFWAIFFQIFSSMVMLIEKLVNHTMLGITLPTASFFTIESIGVIVLGGVVGKFWQVMAAKGKPVHDGTKFAIAMIIMTIAFASFAVIVSTHNPAVLIPGYIIVFLYFGVALSELSLSPIGLSVSNKLAPPNSRGLFMGIWMISLGLGGKLSGMLAGIAIVPDTATTLEVYQVYGHALWAFAGISSGALVLSVVAIPFLKKLMK
jgi:POT family proton-dependent oligopeptide transporter